MGTALINIPLFWGIYWYGYEKLKFYFETESNFILPIQHILSATIAGGIADIVTNPFWVVRTRIQTLIMHPERHFDTSVPSTLTMFRTIYEQEGFRAFYRGLSASFLGLPHVAIQFPLYEYLKQFSCQQRGKQESSAIDHFFASIIAKSIACSITYPHEVLRARMQDTTHRLTSSMTSSRSLIASSSLVMLTKKIIHEEGIKALWSGFRISMIRVIPSTTSSFITYEYITKLLRARRE